ncbi:hypothetical protein CK203_112162 [Vitis vinifera]|uniref:Uncharacterized protein n=1 Tax=Vitis vinifera TaxID=29760 RepID=A0A438CBQ9_VITVI|nr:hypothetical protein CK203_112162 [Vitis vinifera]
MAALLHFEEKVHTRRLARALHSLLFPRLLCHVLGIWVFLQTLILSPAAIVERAFSLDQWNQYGSISIPQTSRAKGSPSCSVHFSSLGACTRGSIDLYATSCSSYLRAAHYYPWCRAS